MNPNCGVTTRRSEPRRGSALSRDFLGYAEANPVVHVDAVKEGVCALRELP
jgi:hypothetical protein